jgi:nucleotidyltransferase substrate binding protein (TIGR01987 family)
MPDIRWKQRFNNYIKALQNLRAAIQLMETRELSDLEKQGVIQSFEFTHELAWNVLKDYLQDQGLTEIVGSKDASRMAFKNGLIAQGEHWMDMIKARNLTSHTYDPETAQKIVDDVQDKFYPAFEDLAKKFTPLYEQPDNAQ